MNKIVATVAIGLSLLGPVQAQRDLPLAGDVASRVDQPSATMPFPLEKLATRSRTILEQIVTTEKSWVKVHAAEALIECGETERMHRLFSSELAENEASDYRVGGWRVLAVTSPTPAERSRWVKKIENVFLDPNAPDRSQALESLCKLRSKLQGSALAAAQKLAAEAPERDTLMPLWSLAIAGKPGAVERLAASLRSTDATVRQRAAYSIRWLRPVTPAVLREVALAADRETAAASSYAFVLSAALISGADSTRMTIWGRGLEHVLTEGTAAARSEACQALRLHYAGRDLFKVVHLLDDPESDSKVAGASTILYVWMHPPSRRGSAGPAAPRI